jgi:ribosomal protein S18 acetylase RimI-like enzyme
MVHETSSQIRLREVMSDFNIIKVRSQEDLTAIKALFIAYTSWLDIDLTFQDYQSELASLPGKYAPPTGELLLIRQARDGEPLGCIAVRPLSAQVTLRTCEIKRLYVLPAARGMGVGGQLVAEIMRIAKELGYAEAKLDTLPRMQSAIKTYEKFGFVACEKYYDTPLEGTKFLKAILGDERESQSDVV